jgi:probable phosphoglycerate mutase
MSTKLLLIRHGESTWNVDGRLQGHAESSLSALGEKQAIALGCYLKDEQAGNGLAVVYSSDLLRAQQTARFLVEVCGAPLIIDARLRERDLGIFEGRTVEEVKAEFPVEFAAMRQDPTFVVPGGESWAQLADRAVACVLDIVRSQAAGSEAAGSTVAVVAHGGTIKALLEKLVNVTQHNIANSSITVLQHTADGWRLLRLNETPHFVGLT